MYGCLKWPLHQRQTVIEKCLLYSFNGWLWLRKNYWTHTLTIFQSLIDSGCESYLEFSQWHIWQCTKPVNTASWNILFHLKKTCSTRRLRNCWIIAIIVEYWCNYSTTPQHQLLNLRHGWATTFHCRALPWTVTLWHGWLITFHRFNYLSMP